MPFDEFIIHNLHNFSSCAPRWIRRSLLLLTTIDPEKKTQEEDAQKAPHRAMHVHLCIWQDKVLYINTRFDWEFPRKSLVVSHRCCLIVRLLLEKRARVEISVPHRNIVFNYIYIYFSLSLPLIPSQLVPFSRIAAKQWTMFTVSNQTKKNWNLCVCVSMENHSGNEVCVCRAIILIMRSSNMFADVIWKPAKNSNYNAML